MRFHIQVFKIENNESMPLLPGECEGSHQRLVGSSVTWPVSSSHGEHAETLNKTLGML